ncbi:MAG: hypothetical protein HGA96_17915 [Desulfobulbaceae bacterium]|nr:hypothetical protein [Desulfobulbaceae bacterium]
MNSPSFSDVGCGDGRTASLEVLFFAWLGWIVAIDAVRKLTTSYEGYDEFLFMRNPDGEWLCRLYPAKVSASD